MTLNDELKQRLSGKYKLSDGRVFWMDHLAVDEIMKRLEGFEIRRKSPGLSEYDQWQYLQR
jgi:hypothetical protein